MLRSNDLSTRQESDMNNKGFVVSFVLASGCIGAASAGDWNVVKEMSSVGFIADQQGSRFNGRFGTFDATISFDPSTPAAGKIVGVVETATVNTRDHDRDAALHDSDWFNSAEHPQARFESQSIKKLDDGSFEATGELSLKGRTKPAAMTFTFNPSGANAKFDGKMTINRFDFNVGEGWNDTSWVGQNVQVESKLELAP
jgi:polyisoprenoid-binding protein YceI